MVTMLVSLINLAAFIFQIAIIIRVILSWVNVNPYQNQLAGLVFRITDPVLNPIRRVLPSTGMLDISPLIALIGLSVIQQLLVTVIYSVL